MGNLFQKAWQMVAMVLAVVDAVAKATDISGARDRQRREVFTFTPATMPVMEEPAPAIPVAALAFDAEPVPELEPALAPEPVMVLPEPVPAQLPPTVVDSPAPVVEVVPQRNLEAEALEALRLFLEDLDNDCLGSAKRRVEAMYQFDRDGQQIIAGLNKPHAEGKLDVHILDGLTFKWRDDENYFSSEKFSEVPSEKQVLSLLWALFNQAKKGKRPAKVEVQEAPEVKVAQPLDPAFLERRLEEMKRREEDKARKDRDAKQCRGLFKAACQTGNFGAAKAHLRKLDEVCERVHGDLWNELASLKSKNAGAKKRKQRA